MVTSGPTVKASPREDSTTNSSSKTITTCSRLKPSSQTDGSHVLFVLCYPHVIYIKEPFQRQQFVWVPTRVSWPAAFLIWFTTAGNSSSVRNLWRWTSTSWSSSSSCQGPLHLHPWRHLLPCDLRPMWHSRGLLPGSVRRCSCWSYPTSTGPSGPDLLLHLHQHPLHLHHHLLLPPGV